MSEVITQKRSHLWLGWLGVVFGSFAIVFSTIGIYSESPETPKIEAIVGVGICWSLILAASVWLILEYRRAAIAFGNNELVVRGVFGRKTLRAEEIARVHWQPHLLQLFSPKGNVGVVFGNFPYEDSRRLVGFVRAWMPPELQEGWTERTAHLLTMPPEQRLAERKQQMRSTVRAVVVASPIAGLLCGTAMVCASHFWRVADLFTVTGSILADWTALGIIVGSVILGSFLLLEKAAA